MIPAGDFNRIVAFLEPVQQRNADGRVIQSWEERFRAWAKVLPLRGGEQVMQARLAARTPAIVTIHSSERARSVNAKWRVRVAGRLYDLKEEPREDMDASCFDILVESLS